MTKLQGALPYVGLMAFASMALTRVCDPMLTTFNEEFGVPLAQASHAIAWYALAYGVFQLIWGPLGDRLGMLRVILWAGSACTVLCLLAGFAPQFSILVAVRVAMGAAAANRLSLRLFGQEYRNDIQKLRTAVDTVKRWLAKLALSQTSAWPLRLAANTTF